MAVEYWTLEEVKTQLHVSDEFITELESEQIVTVILHPQKHVRAISTQELDKVRLASVLIKEMDVNLAGVEVILNMRSTMLEMRRQMDRILKHVVEEVRKNLEDRGA